MLYDRGYPAAWLIALHQSLGVHCCIRSPWNFYNATKDLILSGETEQIATLPMSDVSKKACAEPGLSDEPVTVRLVQVDLPDSDETEVLITTLPDHDAYPASEFGELYHQRWFAEENYKTLKSRMEIENFSGYSKTVIEQDLHAKTVTLSMASVLAQEAQNLLCEQAGSHRNMTAKSTSPTPCAR